jgi:hypothetical protein
MKALIVAAIRCSLMFLVPSVTYAISAQWDLDPIAGDWNTAANWTSMGVPNCPADTATFGLSNTTNVSISEDTQVNGIIHAILEQIERRQWVTSMNVLPAVELSKNDT